MKFFHNREIHYLRNQFLFRLCHFLQELKIFLLLSLVFFFYCFFN